MTFYVVVVSDSVYRDPSKDVSGRRAVEILQKMGFRVAGFDYIPNSYTDIIKKVAELPSNVDVVVFIGGTGPSPRDITVDVLESVAWRRIPGFGELFRRVSYEVEGARAVLSRAELYVMPTGRVAVALPGAPRAIEIGLDLLAKLVEHLVNEVKRFEGPHEP